MQKTRQFHGISTGVKLEKQARSILKQSQAMAKADAHKFGMRHEEHAGVEPMLLALSMEFALKAWFVWDHNTLKTKRTHDLLKLFELLNATTKERLDREFGKMWHRITQIFSYRTMGSEKCYTSMPTLSLNGDTFMKSESTGYHSTSPPSSQRWKWYWMNSQRCTGPS